MTAVSLFGILLNLMILPFAFVQKSRQRLAIFMLLLIMHVAASVAYYLYAQTTSADSSLYYDPPQILTDLPTGLGTMFVIRLTQWIKSATGGSFLDLFLIFQAFGFWGIILLMRTLEEISLELGQKQPAITFLMLFLPGLHFWTSAIGKDSALFFGASFAVWAAMHLRARFIQFGLAVFVIMLFRPHIALIAVIALAGAATLDRRAKGYVKLLLLAAASVGAIVVAGTVQTSLNVDVGSAESVGDFFARQSEIAGRMAGGSAVVGAAYPIRLVSLLFRPLFVDAGGAFGLIASFENLFMLFIFGSLLTSFRESLRLAREVFFLRFALFFAVALMLLLALVYYNVGLGLRQRAMYMPGLLTFFAALVAVRRPRSTHPVLSRA